MTGGRARRAALAAMVAGALGAGVAGCSPGGGITSADVQSAISGAFSHLYLLDQTEQGDPAPPIGSLHTSSLCIKGSVTDAQSGPGSDWTCRITYDVDGPGTPVVAVYNLSVNADGCYAADGDGPTALNGSRTIVGPGGVDRHNPLWLIDGCFALV